MYIYCFLFYLLIINLYAFFLFGSDKRKAIRHEWRISEARLFASAFLGGSLGAILGMQIFRHKTKHWYFKYGMPAILAFQLLILAIILTCKFNKL